MIKQILKLSAAALMLSLALPANAELHAVAKKDKYGYADEAGNIVIKQEYQIAMPFENGVAKVKKGDKWGYIDEAGKPVIAIQYEDIQPFDANGVARVKKGKKYGYIRRDGSFYVKPEFDFIGAINDAGYVWVGKGKTIDVAKKGLYLNGTELIKPKYNCLGFFINTDSCDYRSGAPLYPNRPDEMTGNLARLTTSDVPYIWADDGLYNYIFDLSGNTICKVMSYRLGAPKDGYVLAMKGNKKKLKYNYYPADNTNKHWFAKDVEVEAEQLATPPCLPFNNGLAACNTGSGFKFYDTAGRAGNATYTSVKPVGSNGYIVGRNNLFGIVSPSGVEVVSPAYKNILPPPSITDEPILAALDQNNLCGYIGIDGTVLVPLKYASVTTFRNGFGYVKDANGSWGIVNKDNKVLVAPKWKDMKYCLNPDDEYAVVQDAADEKWYLHSLKTDTHTCKTGFKQANAFDSKGRVCVINDDDLVGAVTASGDVVLPMRFSSIALAGQALEYIDALGKPAMDEIDAYRYNIYINPERHKFKLNQRIDDSMWDY